MTAIGRISRFKITRHTQAGYYLDGGKLGDIFSVSYTHLTLPTICSV